MAGPDEPEVRARIKQWIRLKKEAKEIDDMQGMEAYRLNVILVSQLKVRLPVNFLRLKWYLTVVLRPGPRTGLGFRFLGVIPSSPAVKLLDAFSQTKQNRASNDSIQANLPVLRFIVLDPFLISVT